MPKYNKVKDQITNTKVFHPINKKNLLGEFYVTTVPDIRKMRLLILLKMCLRILLKNCSVNSALFCYIMLLLNFRTKPVFIKEINILNYFNNYENDYSNLKHFKKHDGTAGLSIYK